MKLGVMQPYFFPYIGYWQLINIVDAFVLFDDVNYINRGWINRNRILVNGKVHYINLPMKKASQNKHINEIDVNDVEIRSTLNKIREAYRKAPYFHETMQVIEGFMSEADLCNVATYLRDLIINTCEYLGIKTKIYMSSCMENSGNLRGENRIIDICKRFDCNHYINAIGGVDLYHEEVFGAEHIKLSFLKTDRIVYKQYGEEFYENLSVLDLLMFNSLDEIKKMLEMCRIIDPPRNKSSDKCKKMCL